MSTSQPRLTINADLPPVFAPLMARDNRHRYYVAYGGRGSAKSWSFGRALLLLSMDRKLRAICVREIQRTIADSVHRLLSDQIAALNAGYYFTVKDAYITNCYGSEFSFHGLRDIDAAKIKSFEGADIAWAEEAHAIRKKSWEILIPTIRVEGSEIWATFNPELDTDDTYTRFVSSPPPNAWVQKVTWRDNPWFPQVLEAERQHLLKTDPVAYRNVWDGEPRTVVEGAIYAQEVVQMVEGRRFRPVPYDPKLRVHTIWDLGWNDQTSIIFAQRLLSEVRIIDYEEASFLRFDQWAKRLRDKDYVYGSHRLPHDGGSKTQGGAGLSAKDMLKPLLGMTPKVVKRPETVEVPIRAARMMFPRVYMDEEKCKRLMECLKRFRRGTPESTGEPGAPVKDEYRHGADAFGTLAMIVDKLTNEDEVRGPTMAPFEPMISDMGMLG